MAALRTMTPSERMAISILGRLTTGRLEFSLPDGRTRVLEGDEAGPSAQVGMHHPAAARRIVLGGAMGMAEGYMDGLWDTPDLCAVLELAAANVAARPTPRVPEPLAPLQRLVHRLRPNTRRGARRNVAAHYDLSNDFYRLWLDRTMTYSCADFEGEADDAGRSAPDRPGAVDPLEAAQERKYQRILELADPAPGDRLLEIGCGWGGFARRAAAEGACRVTGLTLSAEQAREARERARDAGLHDRVEIRLEDYRDATTSETRECMASIEMFEAVGERYWPAFFASVARGLKTGGRAAMQVITMAEDRFAAYRRRVDFTQKHIFPGGMLPSPGAFFAAARRAGLEPSAPRFMGASYARTLTEWLSRFEAALPDVRRLGFDERFIRMWRYYLAYCRAGFLARTIDVMQTRLVKT